MPQITITATGETQTEIPQPSQKPSDAYDPQMQLGVEEPPHDEGEKQRHERLEAADEPDCRVRCSRDGEEEMLVVVAEEGTEAHY